MNFYKRYPADYARKTARLTLVQHGAYTLLLDEVYTSESGLPAKFDELYRICRAMTKVEQEAVRVVADRFLPIADDGLRYNNRATEELSEAAPAMEAARANGKRGGRPRKETQGKPNGLFHENPVGSENITQEKPSSKPPHSSDTHSSEKDERALSSPTGEACKAMRAAGLADVNPSHPTLAVLLMAGVSVDELRSAAEHAVHGKKGFAYALATAAGRRNDAATAVVADKADPEWQKGAT